MSKAKNIVICLDGTGNQVEENLSNVLKLYRTLVKNDEQIVFYDQGVGTLKKTFTWGRLKQKIRHVSGLAFGYGLDVNVIQAYEFIIKHYREQRIDSKPVYDNIYIFGFSRGAHTARVLAGLIYEVGIPRPEQIHLSSAALMAYKQTTLADSNDEKSEDESFEGEGANFRRVVSSRTGAVKFLGVFDTVSSVFVPNSKGYHPPLVREKLPHTANNPAVSNFRHAISVDEKRRMYRVDHWEPRQSYKPNMYSTGESPVQDAKEVWFCGCHSDVGGGYERRKSGLSQIPLIWMINEAKSHGLDVNTRMADYVTGIKPYSSDTKYVYPTPDHTAEAHNSMKGLWRIFECIPKSVKNREWSTRPSFLGYYLPLSEPRFIDKNAIIDQSVFDRIQSVKDYKPENVNSR